MTMPSRIAALTIGLTGAFSWAQTARAGIPVFDAVNATSNIIQNFQLKAIKDSLAAPVDGDTINNYTHNIDKSTSNIDNSTTSIDKSTISIDEHTTNIDKSMVFNTEISADLTWIMNIGNEDEDVPIPRDVSTMLGEILNGKSSDDYAKEFQSAAYYGRDQKDFAGSGVEGSRARKAANDALVKSIELDQKSLESDTALLRSWQLKSNNAEGHGRQLQVANAFAGSQVNQMMKLRAMLLVSEASRAAEAQAAADKEARAIATGRAMRAGLDDLRSQTIAPQPKY